MKKIDDIMEAKSYKSSIFTLKSICVVLCLILAYVLYDHFTEGKFSNKKYREVGEWGENATRYKYNNTIGGKNKKVKKPGGGKNKNWKQSRKNK